METKIIQIEVSKIKSNPFKKFINQGKLDNDTIAKLTEGYKQTTFHENLCARENSEGEIELIYGHHRLEAVKQLYGKKYKISLKVYPYKDFSDEKMLLDMIRENLTHRGDDYKDLADSVMLAKRWLESEKTGVKDFYTYLKDSLGRKKTQNISQGVGARQVSEFLSKQGKTISHMTISKILAIEEKLDEDIKKSVSDKLGRGTIEEGKIGTELAYKLSAIDDKEEQKEILEVVKETKKNISEEKTIKLLTKYKEADDDIKNKVRKKELELEDVPIEVFKKEVKKKAEEELKNNKSKIKVTFIKKYQREAGNSIGETNDKILKTCAFFDVLQKQGVLYDLDWNTMLKVIEAGQNGGKKYTRFMENILEKLQ